VAAILGEEDVCFSPVLRPEEVFRDAHLRERGMITVMPDPDRGDTVQLGFPAHFGEALEEKRRPAPYFGQDTDDVLAALGYQPGQRYQPMRSSGFSGRGGAFSSLQATRTVRSRMRSDQWKHRAKRFSGPTH